MPTGRETDAIIRGLGTLYTWNLLSPRLGVTTKLTADGRTMLRGELRAVQPGRADRRVRAVPPRRDADHDDRVRSGDRRLHDASSRWSIPESTCSSIRTRARRAPTSTPLAWIARSVAGSRWRSPTSARTAPTSSAGPTSAVSIARRRGPLPDGRSVPVFVLVNSHGRSPLPVDESRRLLADVQRPRDGRRKTPRPTAGRRSARTRFRGPSGCRPPAGRPPRARRSAPSARRAT